MLEKLSITNVALIESADINFTSGLNVLSGETGAGKSVILESLNFVLGAKADKSLIRSGQNECKVSAVFNVENNLEIQSLLEEMDFDADDKLIVSRKFTIDGKNSIKLNGNTLNVSMLRKFTGKLVDLHGQSEHYELLNSSNQLNLIDKIGDSDILVIKERIKQKYAEYKELIKELDKLGGSESDRLYRLDILNFQIDEIEKSDVIEGEEEKLLSMKTQFQHYEKIANSLKSVKDGLDSEGCANDILLNVIRCVAPISNLDSKYSDIYNRLSNVVSELDDISSNVNNYLDSLSDFDFDPDEVENRLELIKSLKKKYGNSIHEIYEFLDNAKEERDRLENFSENYEKLLSKKESLQKDLYKEYSLLSAKRKQIAKDFIDGVLTELRQLGMQHAQFDISFNDFPDFENCKFDSANGVDLVDFCFSANKGEPIKSLSQIISGGEMSRFMLAIKARSAKFNDINTFVFDEIDAGISGNIAIVVSKKFAEISKNVQVIAITHLPQIASMADNNLYIEKIEGEISTNTTIKQLDYNGKVVEVMRLVGGANSEVARQLAIELITSAENFKKN